MDEPPESPPSEQDPLAVLRSAVPVELDAAQSDVGWRVLVVLGYVYTFLLLVGVSVASLMGLALAILGEDDGERLLGLVVFIGCFAASGMGWYEYGRNVLRHLRERRR